METPSQDGQKVKALLQVNKEIFNRLESRKNESLIVFQYRLVQEKPNFYSLEEIKVATQVSTILSKWECKISFEEIPPLFQNTPSCSVTNYAELRDFAFGTEKLFGVAFAFLGDALFTMPIIRTLKKNLEGVQVCLGEIEEKLIQTTSAKEKYQEKVNLINNTIGGLLNDPSFQSFQSLWQWDKSLSNPKCTINEDKSEVTSGGSVAALMSQCLTEGEYTWKIQIVHMPNYISFGVAQSTTNNSTWYSYGFDEKGWGWGFKGQCFSHNAQTQGSTSTQSLTNGSVVTIKFKLNTSLSFYHNNVFVGNHPLTPPANVYPAVVFHGIGSLKIISS